MNTTITNFSLAEKLGIVRTVDAIIIADGTVHKGELNALGELMHRIEFDSNFILQARNISEEQSKLILRSMTMDKKRVLMTILEEIAISDGFVHKKESDLLADISSFIGMEQEAKTKKA